MYVVGIWCALVLLSFSIFCPIAGDEGVCLAKEDDYEDGTLVIRLERSKSGQWTTTVMTNDLMDDLMNGTAVNINRKLFQCSGQEVTVIKAVIAVPKNLSKEKIKFYHKGGKNIVVSNEGLTATRMRGEEDKGFGGILTDKPLKNNQLFEVKLNKVINIYTSSLGIGISQYNPETSPYPLWMSSGTVMLYDNQLYEGEIVANQDYGSNLRKLKAGDRIGVIKKDNGELHFYINGEDQGVAKTGINYEVYGVVDLYASAIEASII